MSSPGPSLASPGAPRASFIETHHARIPWCWAVWLAMPWATLHYLELCGGAPLTFTMRKFIDDPACLALLGSVNTVFNFAVGALTSYMSDRIWTPSGRRRPFLIAGWTGVALALALLPLATTPWALVGLILLFHFCQDVAKPYEPLYNEVVPPLQRGRAGTVRNVFVNLTGLVFSAVMLAQFDREYRFAAFGGSFRITGEMALYWLGSVVVLGVVLLLTLRVREIPPRLIVRERFQLRTFLRDVFGQRQWWMVYLLFACPFLSGMMLTTFVPLFETEQLGFTKSQVGYAGAITMLSGIACFVPLAGLLSDRVSRLRLFQIGLIGPALVNFTLFLVVRANANHAIGFGTLVAFQVVANAFLSLLFVVWGPLLYDYVPSDRFGTVSAGFCVVGGIVGFVLLNATGGWIKLFTAWAGHGGGAAFDYSSVYVFQLVGAVGALALTFYFQRELTRGRIVVYGRLEPARGAEGAPTN